VKAWTVENVHAFFMIFKQDSQRKKVFFQLRKPALFLAIIVEKRKCKGE
jgi:hypothetical protein